MPAELPGDELSWRLLGAQATWCVAQLVEDDLPELATALLIAGVDTPALRVLAGEPSDGISADLGPQLAEVLQELERPKLTLEEAWRARIAYACWKMTTGRIERDNVLMGLWGDLWIPELPVDVDTVVTRFYSRVLDLEISEEMWAPEGLDPETIVDEALADAADVVQRFLSGEPLSDPLPVEAEHPQPRRRLWSVRTWARR